MFAKSSNKFVEGIMDVVATIPNTIGQQLHPVSSITLGRKHREQLQSHDLTHTKFSDVSQFSLKMKASLPALQSVNEPVPHLHA